MEDLEARLSEMDIGSKSGAKRHVNEHREDIGYPCLSCPQVYEDVNGLCAHLRANKEHLYGQERLRASKREFNARLGRDGDNLLPSNEYGDELTPVLRRTLRRLQATEALLVTLRGRRGA